MKYTVKQYALSLYQVLTETNPKDHDFVIDNFIRVLKGNKDLPAYEKIVTEVEQLFGTESITSKIEVTTAKEQSYNEKLLKDLNKYAKQNADIVHKVEPNILGGVVIKVDDTLIDASLKTQLENLREELKK